MIVLFFIDVTCGALAFYADTNRNAGLALVALSFIFNFFWAASFYSVSNLLPTEIATVKLRNYTMSYTIAWCQTTAVITTFVVPQLTAATGANLGAKTYLVFAGCMFCIIIWTFLLVPETKGRTFAEIDEMYAAKVCCPASAPLPCVCRTDHVADAPRRSPSAAGPATRPAQRPRRRASCPRVSSKPRRASKPSVATGSEPV